MREDIDSEYKSQTITHMRTYLTRNPAA